jgi:hypothetical protein
MSEEMRSAYIAGIGWFEYAADIYAAQVTRSKASLASEVADRGQFPRRDGSGVLTAGTLARRYGREELAAIVADWETAARETERAAAMLVDPSISWDRCTVCGEMMPTTDIGTDGACHECEDQHAAETADAPAPEYVEPAPTEPTDDAQRAAQAEARRETVRAQVARAIRLGSVYALPDSVTGEFLTSCHRASVRTRGNETEGTLDLCAECGEEVTVFGVDPWHHPATAPAEYNAPCRTCRAWHPTDRLHSVYWTCEDCTGRQWMMVDGTFYVIGAEMRAWVRREYRALVNAQRTGGMLGRGYMTAIIREDFRVLDPLDMVDAETAAPEPRTYSGPTCDTTGVMFTYLPDVVDAVDYRKPADMFDRWWVVAYDPRGWSYADDDREAMDETNFDAVCEGLGFTVSDIPRDDISYGATPAAWERAAADFEREATEVGAALVSVGIRGTHAASARVLIIDPTRYVNGERGTDGDDRHSLRGTMAEELCKALGDYPILDESAYSERESDAWAEYAPQAARDELRDASAVVRADHTAEGDACETVLDALDPRAVAEVTSAGMHYAYGFSGDYAPNMLPILARMLATDETARYVGHDAEYARQRLGATSAVRCCELIHALERGIGAKG